MEEENVHFLKYGEGIILLFFQFQKKMPKRVIFKTGKDFFRKLLVDTMTPGKKKQQKTNK